MSIDVTDATFETEVLARSEQVPVVVDLWAEWCGPCRTLGPILDKVVDETEGKVVLAKVDTDANPQTAQAFQVQSIPAVYALVDRKVVANFVGAKGEREVRQFVQDLIPSPEQLRLAALLAVGDEESLREALELAPADETAVVALAELLVTAGSTDEALGLLERIPPTATTRQVAARARLATTGIADAGDGGIEERLGALLDTVKDDPEARTEFLDLLELLGATDPRTVEWRRKLTTRLY
jgi:putative thioredoxin